MLSVVSVFGLVAITTTHCTAHMSVAWRSGSVGTCNISVSREWDGHSRSVDARGPIDHDSVRLAQACPNNYYNVCRQNSFYTSKNLFESSNVMLASVLNLVSVKHKLPDQRR